MDFNANKVLKLGYAMNKLKNKTRIGVVIISNELVKEIDRQILRGDDLFNHLRRSLPMIYKPARWVDFEIGGYYLKPTNIMRVQESAQEHVLRHADLT